MKIYNKDFVNFLSYIWSDHNVKLNIYSYKALGDYENIYQIHPQLKSYDFFEKANYYDLSFIKNKLFNLVLDSSQNIKSIKILDRNQIYADIQGYQNIFPASVKDKKTFDEYIDNNNTINNLENIIQLSQSNLKNGAYNMQFRNNIDNYLILSNKITLGEKEGLKFSWLYLILFIFIGVSLEWLIIQKYKKGDLI